MNKYFKYLELSFYDSLYYRTSSILTFLSSFLIDYVKVAVWYGAVVFAVKRTDNSLINDTVTYMIMASAVSCIYRTDPKNTLSMTYLNGSLIHRFIYPVSIIISNFFESLGRACARIIINVFPTLIILTWVYRPKWNIEAIRIPFFLLNLIIGLYMNYILFAFVDVMCFWLKDTSILQRVRELVFKFFSGSLLPLWVFSSLLSDISSYMPFEKQIYSPVAYLLGIMINDVFFRNMVILIVYCVVMTVFVCILWERGIQRVESYGG